MWLLFRVQEPQVTVASLRSIGARAGGADLVRVRGGADGEGGVCQGVWLYAVHRAYQGQHYREEHQPVEEAKYYGECKHLHRTNFKFAEPTF